MRGLRFVLAVVAASSTVVAQRPLISARGVVNAASYISGGLPGGSIARGSLFSIFGANLGPLTSPGLAFPLSTNLGGVTVQVTQGSTTVAAIPTFVSPFQVNAIMPSKAPLGAVSIYVTFGGLTSPPNPARIVADSFGTFAINSGGSGPGVMQNFVSATSLPLNSTTTAAQPGQTIVLYGTGLGAALNADNVAPAAGNLPTKVEVFVGGQLAPTSYSGRSPCCAGLDQIAFIVPANAPLGCWVPVQIRTSGTTVSNTTTMAISADGSPCSDSNNALSAPFLRGQKVGLIALLRTDVIEDVGTQVPNQPAANNVTTDSIMMTFQQETATPFTFNPIFSLPPPGSCTAYTAAGDLFDGDPLPGALSSGKFLNAGTPLTVSSATGKRMPKRPASNERNFQPLGYTYTGSLVPSTLFLSPGVFTISGPGGPDAGSFQGQVTLATPLAWSNRAQTTTIVRSQGFTVNWTGAPNGQSVLIVGGGVDVPTNSSAIFACVAPAGASSFAVPSAILGNVPATRVNLLQSKGAVYVGALPTQNPATCSAAGIDFGAMVGGAFFGKTVIFQ